MAIFFQSLSTGKSNQSLEELQYVIQQVPRYKIDSIVASTRTMRRKMLNGTEMEWEALFSR
jgi:hypothetical protein